MTSPYGEVVVTNPKTESVNNDYSVLVYDRDYLLSVDHESATQG